MELLAPLIVLVIYLLIFAFVLVSSFISTLIYGAIIGAIPLMCGLMTKKKTLGWVGFFVSFALYWFSGFLLAQLASALFVYFILREAKKE